MPSHALITRFSPLFLWPMLAACNAVNPYYNPQLSHHTPSGFKNNYAETVNKSLTEVARWQWESFQNGTPKPPEHATDIVVPDLSRLNAYAQVSLRPAPQITWVGHATMLVQAGGLSVLTDPVFSDRASPVQFAGPKRAQPPGVALVDLPPIDVVLISHNHYDHLDRNTVQALNQRSHGATLFIVPLGLKTWFADLGIVNVRELDWWQCTSVQPNTSSAPAVEFHLTPVQHWSARGLGDRSATLWGGWAVFAPEFHWYFSGDTGYSQDFKDTRKHFAPRWKDNGRDLHDGFDLALIAVGAYEPRWFMASQHVNPAEAVQIHRDLHAKRSVGVHWGTFNLTDESLDQPPKDLAIALQANDLTEQDFFLLKIGETRTLPAR
jgi:N-acyl-phosphatidylethanolamine-hydrolysing phospholipase D